MLGPTFYAWNGECEEYFNADKYANTDKTKCEVWKDLDLIEIIGKTEGQLRERQERDNSKGNLLVSYAENEIEEMVASYFDATDNMKRQHQQLYNKIKEVINDRK
jgi:hypothetical protein